MQHRLHRLGVCAVLGAAFVLTSVGLRADEGFWLFNAAPKAAIASKYGFQVTDAWLDHVRLSSVRFGGASGSFVSPDGLVLTNHHVGLSAIQKLSTPDRDLVKAGFYARTHAEELKAADTELNVLVGIEDVTARVNAAASGKPQAEAFGARKAAINTIEKEATDGTAVKGEVVTLYQGAQYHLYTYKRYTDVRLVFSPGFDIAFFGGDPDNFTYPRYDLDICLFRVYENNQPAHVEHYLRWSPEGTRDGELVFTSGHPGATQRLNTVAHLEYLRDVGMPMSLAALERRRAVLVRYAEQGPEQARQVKDEVFGIENALKSRRGQLEGLKDATLMTDKRQAEAGLQQAVMRDEKMKATFGNPWTDIATARQGLRSYAKEQDLIESGNGFATRYFSIARQIVRLVEEDQKPDADRLSEFSDARRPSLERQLYSAAPIHRDAEIVKLADSLTALVQDLGPEHPVVKAALAGQSPEARAKALVAGTTVGDVTARKALVASGTAGVAASQDPMIQLARAIDPAARALRTRYEREVVSVERDAYARIAQALFAVEGPRAYPDATSTLRLSYGQVQGYMENGKAIPPFTDFNGLYAWAQQHGNRDPWKLPQRWEERRAKLALDTPFNLVTTNDIVGGNSGSPLVNTKGEFVGVAFDGNIQSLPGYFMYDGSVNRTVVVDSRGIIEAMRTVYDAQPLVDELLQRKPVEATSTSTR